MCLDFVTGFDPLAAFDSSHLFVLRSNEFLFTICVEDSHAILDL